MILIIDDDSSIRTSLAFMLKRAGYEVAVAVTPQEAVDRVRRHHFSLILMDMNYSLSTTGEEGLVLLRQVKIFAPEVPVILMTAWGSIGLAVEGMKAGAFDFITKPWSNAALLQRIETAVNLASREAESQEEADSSFDRGGIIGCSAALNEVLQTVVRVARTNASVLITGESGTGKELIAEVLHRNSNRKDGPFVKVNLGGISQSLFESEMFGHVKGAFTDAASDRTGRFQMAHKGTIFLDEIGELDLSCQVKLLRVLQDQTFERLGESRPTKVDVRVVSATNADLGKLVSAHDFREDLFYRINLITVRLPALRERKEDIPLLVRHFACGLCEANGLPPAGFTAGALEYLSGLSFPGNIRELKNRVERAILLNGNSELDASCFQGSLQEIGPGQTVVAGQGLTLDELERLSIVRSLAHHANNLSRVAAELGISRASLYRRLEKYSILIREEK